MRARQLIERLDKTRRSGDGWMALCPAHDDSHPSLSVAEGHDGTILLYCHAGCSFEEIRSALGLDSADLSSPSDSGPGYTLTDYADEKNLPAAQLRQWGVKTQERSDKPPVVAIPYPDRDGEIDGVKIRDGGQFWWDGHSTLPYGLDRLTDADDEAPVLLVEGESDCHAVWLEDVLAVGVPGANGWRSEWTQYFEDREVFVWQEPDDAGEEFVQSITEDLPEAKVIEAPEDAEDPAELHATLSGDASFRGRLKHLMQSAEPASNRQSDGVELTSLSEVEPEEVQSSAQATNGDTQNGEDSSIQDRLQRLGAHSLGDDPPPEAVNTVLRRWASSLDGADPLQVELERKALARQSGITAQMVDAALDSQGSHEPSGDRQGTSVEFEDPEPWPESVDGAETLTALEATFRRFLALPDGAAPTLALWAVHAHAHSVADISPVLALTSPTKRCGKTTALEVLGALVPRPLPAANITAASLFRAVEKYSPTLLIDEADTFLRNGDDLRGVLNSGHSRRSAFIVRTVGDDYEPRRFKTWAPKAIALIGELPDTLADRSIEVRMRRRSPDEKIERLRRDRLGELDSLQRKAWTWVQAHADELEALDPDPPTDLQDRARDNWRPLIAIAELAGGQWPSRARRAASVLTDGGEEHSAAVMLLEDLKELFEERGVDRLASRDICSELADLEERPWPEWKAGKAVTPRQLAKLLGAFEIEPEPLWLDSKTRRGYKREKFEDAWTRYVEGQHRKERKDPDGDAAPDGTPTRKEGDGPYGSEPPQDNGAQAKLTDLTGKEGGPDQKSGSTTEELVTR